MGEKPVVAVSYSNPHMSKSKRPKKKVSVHRKTVSEHDAVRLLEEKGFSMEPDKKEQLQAFRHLK